MEEEISKDPIQKIESITKLQRPYIRSAFKKLALESPENAK